MVRMSPWIITLSVLSAVVLAALVVFRHPAFGPHPFGRRGVHYENELPTPQFTGKGGFSAIWDFLTDRSHERYPETPVEIERNDIRTLLSEASLTSPSRDLFIWFGHSSYLLTLGGNTVLVDPVLKMEFPSSLMMTPFAGTDYYTPDDMPDIDLLVITHEHWDHLDYATLRDLRPKVRHVVCPLGIAGYLVYWGYDPALVTEMNWYDSVSVGGLKTTCLPTRHFSNRLFGANQTLWASFLLDFNGKKAYIGGDGGYDDRFYRIRDRYGVPDLAIMENGQYNPNWAYIHMLPADLEQAMLDLQAKQYITVHHDKFSLAPHAWNEPDSVARAIASKHNLILLDAPIGHLTEW